VFIARNRNVKLNGATEFDESRHTGIDTILVPVDFSSCSLEGLKYAVGFADSVAARVIVLNVVNVGPLLTGDGYAMYDMSSYRKFTIKQAESEMKKFLHNVKFGPVKVETLVDEGPPIAVITRIAEEKKADLIVTATHGRTGFDHLLIGSTAEAVVRHAPCSVLVVPSHPQERVKHLGKMNRGKVKPRLLTTRELPSVGEDTPRELLTARLHPFPERRRTNKFREAHSLR
jgi:nucleotide-binding universal stress UspA family protein